MQTANRYGEKRRKRNKIERAERRGRRGGAFRHMKTVKRNEKYEQYDNSRRMRGTEIPVLRPACPAAVRNALFKARFNRVSKTGNIRNRRVERGAAAGAKRPLRFRFALRTIYHTIPLPLAELKRADVRGHTRTSTRCFSVPVMKTA